MIGNQGFIIFLQAPRENAPVPPPPINDEIQFNDNTYIQYNDGQVIEYNTTSLGERNAKN